MPSHHLKPKTLPFQTLLAYQSVDQTAEDLRPAMQQAFSLKAHVDILVLVEVAPPPVSSFGIIADSYWDDYQRQLASVGVKRKAEIAALMERHGVTGEISVLIINAGEIESHMLTHGSCADIVFVQKGSMFGDKRMAQAFHSVLFSSGLPIMIGDESAKALPDLKRAVIAWDGGVEAARAIRAALYVLKGCDAVSVLCIDAEHVRLGPAPGDAIASYLARHDIHVEVFNEPSNGYAVDVVLAKHAADFNADVIVMGGYGHSRFREWLIGGTTRAVLKNAELPVIMAH